MSDRQARFCDVCGLHIGDFGPRISFVGDFSVTGNINGWSNKQISLTPVKTRRDFCNFKCLRKYIEDGKENKE